MNKLQLEEEISLLLGDIEGYINSAYYLLTETYEYLDKDEIIMYLSTVPEIIIIIRDLISKLKKS